MKRQCLKRKLVPADIARMVLFLAADDSGALHQPELHRRRRLGLSTVL